MYQVNSPVFKCLPIACHNSDACFTTLPQSCMYMYHSLHCLHGITILPNMYVVTLLLQLVSC